MKRYHLVYKTVNTINDKFYIGKHSTDVIDDGYLGSGLLISSAITKYGKENFKREILHWCESSEEASSVEKQLVDENLLLDPHCYNIALGGCGGNLGDDVNRRIGHKISEISSGVPKTTEHKNALKAVWNKKKHTLTAQQKGKIKTTITATWKSMSEDERRLKCGHPGKSNGFYGKTHKESSLTQMKYNLPDRSGSKNPRAKQVTINNVTYATQKECIEALKISKRNLYKLLGESK